MDEPGDLFIRKQGMKRAAQKSILILSLILLFTGSMPDGYPYRSVNKIAARSSKGVKTLDIPIIVKENAATGTPSWPVSAVIPLPQGQFTSTSQLWLAGIPSQVEVMERWPGDGSLRHVQVTFLTEMDANTTHTVHLTNAGVMQSAVPLVVTETQQNIKVETGPMMVVVRKDAFNMIDQAWYDQNGDGQFTSEEKVIASHGKNGGVFTPRAGAGENQYDAQRTDVQVSVESQGPLRAVIAAQAPAIYTDTTHHLHGFAVRLYFYAGLPMVRIDYQLQNSDRQVVRAWPLYFDSFDLDFRLALSPNSSLRFGGMNGETINVVNTAGATMAQEMHNHFKIYQGDGPGVLYDSGALANGVGPPGVVDIRDSRLGVMAAVRNFWQTWPNGLAVDIQNRLSLQLFPSWSAQWYQGQLSPSGLYWLEDMQHVMKEMVISFHGPDTSAAEIDSLSRTFQFPPTAAAGTEWYRQTRATLDLGGVIPLPAFIPEFPDLRQPAYLSGGDPGWYDVTGPYYGAGWVNFLDPEPGYRAASCTTGGWPYSGAARIATGNPADYFTVEGWALAELNLRPQWIAGYNHTLDWERLKLSENPYCGGRWRVFEGHGISKLAAPPLADTGGEEPVYYARDDQHGWFYHLADAYWITGSPWIRDWYHFVGEFRMIRLGRLDPFPDTSSRATGHSLNHALQAYRITGKSSLLAAVRGYISDRLRPEQDPIYGDQLLSVEPGGGGFQTGYLARAVIDYLEEVRNLGDHQAYAEGFNYLSGLMEWNYHYGNFAYYFDARPGGIGQSSGTGLTLVDPQAWYYWHTGRGKYLDQLDQYVASGLNGGESPYGEFRQWNGQFEGRYYLFVKGSQRLDTEPPLTVTDLGAERISPGTLRLHWTAPEGAYRYHIVWSSRPVVEEHTEDPGRVNWWAANVVGPDLAPVAGERQSLDIPVSGEEVYAALFTFDNSDNMSAISNLTWTRWQQEGRLRISLPYVRRK